MNFTKSTLLISFACLFLLGCNINSPRSFWSPYQKVNWAKIDYCDAEFHTHPGLGDEQYDPHQTVDRYYAEGYKILTLSGHDYQIPTEQIGSIYPWTRLESIYETIKDVKNPAEDNKTYGEIANEPYQDRNPVELGMVSVEGCEISAPHHVVSLFSSFSSGAENENETFRQITDLGGLAYFAHPGAYKMTGEWYVELYRKYDILLGQSVYNRIDNQPNDRNFFDEVVHALGKERPIWLFGEDDMHRESTLGWNRNVILIENFQPGSMHSDVQDGSAPKVKKALKNGHFYLWKPSEQYNKYSFYITEIETTKQKIKLVFSDERKVKIIRWITYQPEKSQSINFYQGKTLTMDKVPESAKFVRAEIEGEGGTIYTQPFYIDTNS